MYTRQENNREGLPPPSATCYIEQERPEEKKEDEEMPTNSKNKASEAPWTSGPKQHQNVQTLWIARNLPGTSGLDDPKACQLSG